MSVNDLLTQEEIKALLSGQSSDDVIISEKASKSDAADDDPVMEDWGDNQQIPALALLNRRYAQLFRDIFFNLLRKDAKVSNCGVQLVSCSDYIGGLYIPSSVNRVQVKPLKGTALFVFDPDLVFMIVENYFGGDGRCRNRIKKQNLSPMELRVIELLLEKIFVSLKKAWEPVMPLDFELISSIVNSQLSDVEDPEETLVVSSFCVEIDSDVDELEKAELPKGELQLSMPYPLLEDILGTDV